MTRARDRHTRRTLAAPPPDPFGEHERLPFRRRLGLLGTRFEFESNSARLLRIVDLAYEGLPQHRLARDGRGIRLSLLLTSGPGTKGGSEPPVVRSLAAGGILCGAFEGAGFAALAPQQRSGLLIVPNQLLRFPYHLRYELLEFAVYVLAARIQRLVPLHAGCLGHAGEGILLIGASGTGKSTLVLHGLLRGLELLAEDSVLVEPGRLRATGVASFVHLRQDALRFLAVRDRRRLLPKATVIRRRSGVEKLEIDVRSMRYSLARPPLTVRAVVFLSRRVANGSQLLVPLESETMLRRLEASQRYAARQHGWMSFREQIRHLPAYELRRAAHPDAAVEVLKRELLTA